MPDEEHEHRCPLSAVDRRLEDVHRFWHEAERGYFDPENFRVAIQTAIQTLRTVTFILQSNKRIFPDFENWYDAWQVRLRADPLMRWMVDARNKIEKQGDLDSHSFVRAEIMASYYDEGPRIDIPAELFKSSAELFGSIPNEQLRAHIFKDGILRIQRRWVENTLPEFELLEAVAIAYGRIAELVADAHVQLGLEPPAVTTGKANPRDGEPSRSGRLPCMIGHSDARSVDIWLETGKPMEIQQRPVEFDTDVAQLAAKNYGINETEIFQSDDPDPEATLNQLFITARRVFLVDGHHNHIAFLLKAARPAGIIQLDIQHHGEKYLVMRMLAHEVLKRGADGVIVLGEIWSSPYDSKNPYRRAADAPNRSEYLSGSLVTKTGDAVQLLALIKREGNTVTVGETFELRNQAQISFAPIYAVWKRAIPSDWIKATSLGARDTALGGDDPPDM